MCNFDASCRCLLYYHKRPRWISNTIWVFTLGIFQRLLLGSLTFDWWSFNAKLADYYFDEIVFPLLEIYKVSMNEQHKRLRFSPHIRKMFFHLNPHTLKCENETIKVTNSNYWCFLARIVIPKEQHESWIKIIMPKACKTLKNKGKNKDFL